MDTWKSAFAAVSSLCQSGQTEAAVGIVWARTVPLYESIGEDSASLARIQEPTLEDDKTAAGRLESRSRWLTMFLIALAIGAGMIGFVVVRQITRTLRGIAVEMGEGAEQVASAAAQMSSSSQGLAQGTSQQSASIEKTSASMEEISSMTRGNAPPGR